MLDRMLASTKRRPKARPYQLEAVRLVHQEWDEGRMRVLIVAPTGSGKTVIAGFLVADEVESGGRVLALTDRKKLTRQFAHRTEQDFGIPCGIEMASEGHEQERVVSATVQTITTRIKQGKFHPEDFSMIFMDEAHLALGAGWQAAAAHFPKAKVVGLTATPVSSSQKDLLTFFDSKVEPATLKDLIEQKWLAPIKVKNFPIQIRVESRSKNADFNEEDISHAIDPYLASCADELVAIGKNRACLVFLPLIATSKKFAGLLNERGFTTEHVDGEMDEKQVSDAIKRLEMGVTKCLTCSMLLAIGVDIKCISCILSLRLTKSWTLFCQQIGRGTRTFDPAKDGPEGTLWPKKDDLLVCDPLWLTDNHNLLQRPATLFAKNEEEARVMDKKLEKGGDLLEAFGSMVNEREEALKKRLEAMAQRKSREVDAMEFFSQIGRIDLAEYEPMARWERENMTGGQRALLLKNKIDLSTVKDRGHASKICDALIARIKSGMSTIPQAKWAAELGLADAYSRSFEDVSNFISVKKAGGDPFIGYPDI